MFPEKSYDNIKTINFESGEMRYKLEHLTLKI